MQSNHEKPLEISFLSVPFNESCPLSQSFCGLHMELPAHTGCSVILVDRCAIRESQEIPEFA